MAVAPHVLDLLFSPCRRSKEVRELLEGSSPPSLLRARAAEQAARAGSRRTASLAELAQAGRKMGSMGSVALAQKGGCAHVAKTQRGSIVQTLQAGGGGAN